MKKNSKNLSLRERDPFLERERQCYESPLPSREWIMALLEQEKRPLQVAELAEKLSITTGDRRNGRP